MQHDAGDWRDKTPDVLAGDAAKGCGLIFVIVCAGALILATLQGVAVTAWSLATADGGKAVKPRKGN